MTAPKRPQRGAPVNAYIRAFFVYLFGTFLFVVVCLTIPEETKKTSLSSSTDPSSFSRLVEQERQQLISESKKLLRETESLNTGTAVHRDTITLKETIQYLSDWLHKLHQTLLDARGGDYLHVWQAYHDLAIQTLIPWDETYLTQRMPPRRQDGSIFLSVASYRDENCVNTLQWAFGNATHPERVFVGLVQQNCVEDCLSGILEGGRVVHQGPDPDCYDLFCKTNPTHCPQVRLLRVNESESLGPYGARYFASKLWYGESWYMQVDAHMTFLNGWDVVSIDMLHKAPAQKPVISHYPPGHKMDLVEQSFKPAGRLCGPLFATSSQENQIVRLEGLGVSTCVCVVVLLLLWNDAAHGWLLFFFENTEMGQGQTGHSPVCSVCSGGLFCGTLGFSAGGAL